MSEPNEQETPDAEPSQEPVSPETVVDDETAEEEEHEAEEAAQEPTEALAPVSEKEIEKANKALEREATAHANRISKIMGEDAQNLVPCELCWPLTPGFHWPAGATPIEEPQLQAVLAAVGMGEGEPRKLRPAKGVSECESCAGEGLLEFPTKVPHVREQSCPKCNGSGYTLDAPVTAAPLAFELVQAPENGASVQSAPPCPLCGAPDSAGKAHWCAPQPAQVGV